MQKMTAYATPDRSHQPAYFSVVRFTIIFAAITYAATSLRAVLSPFEINYFFDAKRGLSVAIGAFILLLSIRAIDRAAQSGLGAQIIAALNIAIPGAIGLLLARELFDLAASGAFAQRFALNMRWMLNWIGYFAAGLASFLALGYHRQLQTLRSQSAVLASDIETTKSYELADLDFEPRRQN